MYKVYANTIQNLHKSYRFKFFLKEAREGLHVGPPYPVVLLIDAVSLNGAANAVRVHGANDNYRQLHRVGIGRTFTGGRQDSSSHQTRTFTVDYSRIFYSILIIQRRRSRCVV